MYLTHDLGDATGLSKNEAVKHQKAYCRIGYMVVVTIYVSNHRRFAGDVVNITPAELNIEGVQMIGCVFMRARACVCVYACVFYFNLQFC